MLLSVLYLGILLVFELIFIVCQGAHKKIVETSKEGELPLSISTLALFNDFQSVTIKTLGVIFICSTYIGTTKKKCNTLVLTEYLK